MFCLIWLLGGGTGAPEGAGGAAGWEDLEEEWLDVAEVAPAAGALEEEDDDDEEEWLLDGGSFCGGCFLGMVKLDFMTLSAPVMWMGPEWNGAGVGVEVEGAPGFLDFGLGLAGGVAFFLLDLEAA